MAFRERLDSIDDDEMLQLPRGYECRYRLPNLKPADDQGHPRVQLYADEPPRAYLDWPSVEYRFRVQAYDAIEARQRLELKLCRDGICQKERRDIAIYQLLDIVPCVSVMND